MSVRETCGGGVRVGSGDHRRRSKPTCRRCSSAIRPAAATCSRSCSSRASRRCRPIAWPTGCGPRAARRWPSTCRAACPRSSRSTSIRPRRIGKGVFIDHGTGIVIGETAVIGDDVSMLQGVTLGGTGAERGDRHPKIGRGVLLGAGAKVIGNITIGDYAKVASGAVVLKNVPPGCTAVGVPARLVNCPTCEEPARSMDHTPRRRRLRAGLRDLTLAPPANAARVAPDLPSGLGGPRPWTRETSSASRRT